MKKEEGVWVPQIILNLDLLLTEKLILAIIYSYKSKDCFCCNDYFAKKLGISTGSVSTAINKLKREKLIKYTISFDKKRYLQINQDLNQVKKSNFLKLGKYVKYPAKICQGVDKIYQGVFQDLSGGLPNLENSTLYTINITIKIYYKNNLKVISTPDFKFNYNSFLDNGVMKEDKTQKIIKDPYLIVDKIIEDYELKRALKEFIVYFNDSHHKLSSKQFQRMLKKLDEITKDKNEKLAVIDKTIERGWKSFFPVNEKSKFGQQVSELKGNKPLNLSKKRY
jgi:DNA-binding Lrp family transcriptional regulator